MKNSLLRLIHDIGIVLLIKIIQKRRYFMFKIYQKNFNLYLRPLYNNIKSKESFLIEIMNTTQKFYIINQYMTKNYI